MGSSTVLLKSASLYLMFIYDGMGPSLSVASVAEPDLWMELGFLWHALTGDRPNPQLEGWAWFFRDHLQELSVALGADFPATRVAFMQKTAESREILARHVPQPSLLVSVLRFRQTALGAIVMGPMGWVVGVAMLIWEFIR